MRKKASVEEQRKLRRLEYLKSKKTAKGLARRQQQKEKYILDDTFREQRKGAARERYKTNKDNQRRLFLKRVYNLTPEEYELIFKFQAGVCAITGKAPTGTRLHIDHDHKTGRIRGLLSWRVNQALSSFGDNPEMLRKAADYLENPPAVTALGKEVYGLLGKAKLKKKMVYGKPKQ